MLKENFDYPKVVSTSDDHNGNVVYTFDREIRSITRDGKSLRCSPVHMSISSDDGDYYVDWNETFGEDGKSLQVKLKSPEDIDIFTFGLAYGETDEKSDFDISDMYCYYSDGSLKEISSSWRDEDYPDVRFLYRDLDYDKSGRVISAHFYEGANYYFREDNPGSLVRHNDCDYLVYMSTANDNDPIYGTPTSIFYYMSNSGNLLGVSVEGDHNFENGGYYSVDFNPDGSLASNDLTFIEGIGRYDPSIGKWINENGEIIDDPDLTKYLELAGFKLIRNEPRREVVWYDNNTSGVLGLSLRDEYPGLTSKWYNILPVDLSQDGTQSFQMVASNLYYIGDLTVTVSGDSVTTEYSLPNNTIYEVYPKGECIAWFTGIEEITSDFLDNPVSTMKFGEAVSKEKDLSGQDAALLFVCNRITYSVPLNSSGAMPIRFWRNHYKLEPYYNDLRAVLAKIEQEYAENHD